MSREGDESVYYKASVIIPVYQAETTLRRCVESVVLGQERDIEVVLVEDCSKDRSWQVCQELTQEFSNVIAVQNEKNSGVSYTRNHGLELAQGEYVLFVDSDDWVSKRYVKKLLRLVEDYPSTLPIVGLHFIDKVHRLKKDYLWTGKVGEKTVVSNTLLFEVLERFLLQQLWNKIFRREIIMSNNLRFDESQSMGEDFQFVLDYIEASRIQQYIILDEPLYYYIRWNDTSLMSFFGPSQNRQEYRRIERLYQLSGLDNKKILEQKLIEIKHNYVYHISRNNRLNKREKLKIIEQVMQDGRNKEYYARQRLSLAKEKAVDCLRFCKRVPIRLKHKIFRIKRTIKVWYMRSSVKKNNVTIISQNCIGGVIYHDLGMQFLSPTINVFFKGPDFVRFVLSLQYYMACELDMRWEEEYPVGQLDNVEIHFMHYGTCKEALEKWNRRKNRINWKNILVLATDRNGFDEDVFESWRIIPYKKALFTVNPEFGKDKDSIFFQKYIDHEVVPELITRREFYQDGRLVRLMNSFGEKDQ